MEVFTAYTPMIASSSLLKTKKFETKNSRMKKIIHTVFFLIVTMLTVSAVHGSGKDKRHREVIPCAPLKQSVVEAPVKKNRSDLISDLILPSPLLL